MTVTFGAPFRVVAASAATGAASASAATRTSMILR